jgi:DNA modification methylase
MSVQLPLITDPNVRESSESKLLPKGSAPRIVEAVPPLFYPSPNPHLDDFVCLDLPPKQVISPYASNISAGKNTYIYDAHTYHTKVPPKGIELLINHYTRPGDVVLDPFCGSGMTGIAAIETGRKAIISDLSPAATFIAYNLTTPIASERYEKAVRAVLEMACDLEHKLYDTHCRTCGKSTPMLYMVWSYGMLCYYCEREFVLWDVARDERPRVRDSKVKKEFDCPHCGKLLEKRKLKRTRRYPVSVGYKCCIRSLQESSASPDEYDLALLDRIKTQGIPKELWFPTTAFPDGMNTKQPIAAGITSVDKAYTPRALWAMAFLWDIATRWNDPDVRHKLLFTITSLYQRVTSFSEFRFWGGSSNTANYNVPTIINEQNVFKTFERKAKTINLYFSNTSINENPQVRVSTQSACHLTQLPDSSVDYVFTDPPFGSNINYSEMNLLWESWLGVRTDTTEEAIVHKVQGKGIAEYEQLLQRAMSEIRRVLKDGGWLTVVFHNSAASVWAALQRAISGAGFDIIGTQTFDKEHGTFKQFVANNAVGYDLVLHCRKSSSSNITEVTDRGIARQEAIAFIRKRLHEAKSQYVVRYVHVTRRDEFDYRRLYAEWLAKSLTQTLIGLSFAEFRALIEDELNSLIEVAE